MTESTDNNSEETFAGLDPQAPNNAENASPSETASVAEAGPPAEPFASGEQAAPAGSAFTPAAEPKAAKSPKAGLLIAGVAVGALLGGAAGAGVTAITLTQMQSQTSSDYTRDAITIANKDNATLVSGIAAKASPSVVTLEVSTADAAGTGSGVIIDPSGYILTNNHVVTLDTGDTKASIRVFLSDGRIFTGKLVGTDPYADLAVVKIDATDLQAIKFANSEKLNVGDLTVAIGAPLNLANTVTTGVISALNRGITVGTASLPGNPQSEEPTDPNDMWNFELDQNQKTQKSSGSITIPVIQTDASINPGNSGGALLDANGNLIGINVAIASTASSTESAGSVGLGFAIPSNLAKRVADSLIAGDKVSHGLLGIGVGDSSSQDGASQSGGLVVDVTAGGAGAKAGLKKGDVITAINGITVLDGTSLSGLVRYYPAGTEVKLDYIRDGKVATTTATLGSL